MTAHIVSSVVLSACRLSVGNFKTSCLIAYFPGKRQEINITKKKKAGDKKSST